MGSLNTHKHTANMAVLRGLDILIILMFFKMESLVLSCINVKINGENIHCED